MSPMPGKVQIAFDCHDPDALARFYAGALHYKLQDPPPGFSSWDSFLQAQGVPVEERELTSAIVDPGGTGPRIFFQKMDTPKPGKNRLHLDVNASSGGKASLEQRKREVLSEAERISALGARKQQEFEEDGEYWIVMLDPEGNEFCIQ